MAHWQLLYSFVSMTCCLWVRQTVPVCLVLLVLLGRFVGEVVSLCRVRAALERRAVPLQMGRPVGPVRNNKVFL